MTTTKPVQVDTERLRRQLDHELERFEVPGLAVGVTVGTEVVFAETFGQRDLATAAAVTPHTLFAIGSTTKSFTAALVASLVEDGQLTWDEPVRQYLPTLKLADPHANELLTLRDMLAHRSGLPRHDLVWYGNDQLTRADAVVALAHLAPSFSFRERWQYNNLMYLAAGHVCEVVLGMPWEDAVAERLLHPLGMCRTNFSAADATADPDVATPYMAVGEAVEPVAFRDLGACGPAGSMNADLTDMLRWAVAHANGTTMAGGDWLPAATVQELHQPQMVRRGDPSVTDIVSAGYGLGWFLETYRGSSVSHNGGNIDGFSSMVAVLPSARVGVVALANRHVTMLVNAIPFMVFDEILDLEPRPWAELLRHHAVPPEPAPEAAPDASTRLRGQEASRYAGTYVHPSYGDLRITCRDEQLAVEFHGLDWTTTPAGDGTWLVHSPRMGVTVPLTFTTDASGRVLAATLPLEPTVDPVSFALTA